MLWSSPGTVATNANFVERNPWANWSESVISRRRHHRKGPRALLTLVAMASSCSRKAPGLLLP